MLDILVKKNCEPKVLTRGDGGKVNVGDRWGFWQYLALHSTQTPVETEISLNINFSRQDLIRNQSWMGGGVSGLLEISNIFLKPSLN